MPPDPMNEADAVKLLAAQVQAFMQLLQALVRSHPDPAALQREFHAVTSRAQAARAVSGFGAQPLHEDAAAATALWRELIATQVKRAPGS